MDAGRTFDEKITRYVEERLRLSKYLNETKKMRQKFWETCGGDQGSLQMKQVIKSATSGIDKETTERVEVLAEQMSKILIEYTVYLVRM